MSEPTVLRRVTITPYRDDSVLPEFTTVATVDVHNTEQLGEALHEAVDLASAVISLDQLELRVTFS
jgi:hypothetical protein